jgi:hypothetical protein
VRLVKIRGVGWENNLVEIFAYGFFSMAGLMLGAWLIKLVYHGLRRQDVNI